MGKSKMEKENEAFVEESTKALAEMKDTLRLAPFSEGRDFDRAVNLQELKAITQMNAFCMIELGKRLVFHKENLPHGQFIEDLHEVGLPKRTAYRYMSTARKLAGLPSIKAAQLTMSKAYALAEELDDDEIKLLETKGRVGTVDLDEIDRMTASELRKRLRKMKEKVAKQDTEIEDLEDQLENRTASPQESMHTDLTKAFAAVVLSCTELVTQIERDTGDLNTKVNDKGETVRERMYSSIQQQQSEIFRALKPELLGRSTEEKRRAS